VKEIQPKSGVKVDRQFLKDLQRDWSGDPREMVRRLHKKIIGPADLARMSATGEGLYGAIPTNVRNAVQCKFFIGSYKMKKHKIKIHISNTYHFFGADWVDNHCTASRLTNSEYNRTLNLMCGTIRKRLKKDETSPATTTPPQVKSTVPWIVSPAKSGGQAASLPPPYTSEKSEAQGTDEEDTYAEVPNENIPSFCESPKRQLFFNETTESFKEAEDDFSDTDMPMGIFGTPLPEYGLPSAKKIIGFDEF